MREVLPRADAYEHAENELSAAAAATGFDQHGTASTRACSTAFDLAIALDGLADRFAFERGLAGRKAALAVVRPLCRIASSYRPDAIDRITAVAVAYKHYLVPTRIFRCRA